MTLRSRLDWLICIAAVCSFAVGFDNLEISTDDVAPPEATVVEPEANYVPLPAASTTDAPPTGTGTVKRGSTSGDPHFTTWSGKRYDFMGGW